MLLLSLQTDTKSQRTLTSEIATQVILVCCQLLSVCVQGDLFSWKQLI